MWIQQHSIIEEPGDATKLIVAGIDVVLVELWHWSPASGSLPAATMKKGVIGSLRYTTLRTTSVPTVITAQITNTI